MRFLQALAVVVVTVSVELRAGAAAAGSAAAVRAWSARRAGARAARSAAARAERHAAIRFRIRFPPIEGAIKVNFVEFATLPDVDVNAARPDADELRARHEAHVRQRHARRAVLGEPRRKNGDAVPRPSGSALEHSGAVPEFRARVPELRVSSRLQSARSARVRKDLHLHRHQRTSRRRPTGRMRRARRCRIMRCSSSGPRRIRRPRPTTATPRAS